MTRLIPPPMQEFLAAFQALRQLGFSADEIFCAFGKDGTVHAVLRTQGRAHSIHCGVLAPEERTRDDATLYEEACEMLAAMSDAEIDALKSQSPIFTNAGAEALVGALVSKGFRLPGADGAERGANDN